MLRFSLRWPRYVVVLGILLPSALQSSVAQPAPTLIINATGNPHPIMQVAFIGPDQIPALLPVDGGEARAILRLAVGNAPIGWSEDGHSLFVYRLGEVPARVDKLDLATGRRHPWKQLVPPDVSGAPISAPF